jgi:hypothetical protein
MADWFDQNGGVNPVDPTAQPQPLSTPATTNSQDQINQWYKQYMGIDLTQNPEIAKVAYQSYSTTDPAATEAAIKNSSYAKTYANSLAPRTDYVGTTQIPNYSPTVSLPQLAKLGTYTLPSAADVEATPGYQFTRDQGIQGVMRSDIARGTGLGGAALKDIANYTTGLADTYYGNAVNRGLAANAQTFGQNLGVNQFGLGAFNTNLGAQNQYWGQGLAENQNAFNQYRTTQNDAFNQWLSMAQLGNPGNPYA